jgi:hypothetical protein
VQVLGPGPLLAALVGRQQGLAEPRRFAALGHVAGPDLGHHVGQRDAQRQPAGPDPGGAEARQALGPDHRRDLRRGAPGHHLPGPDLAGQHKLAALVADRGQVGHRRRLALLVRFVTDPVPVRTATLVRVAALVQPATRAPARRPATRLARPPAARPAWRPAGRLAAASVVTGR